MLLSDIDECNLVDNYCTKSGANCTNTVGSFNCTCQTRYFWNGMKCQGLFTVVLFRLMCTSFKGVFLIIFSVCFSLSISFSWSGALCLSEFLSLDCLCVCLFVVGRNFRICSCLGEHEKCARVVRGAADSNSSFLNALQTSQVHP